MANRNYPQKKLFQFEIMPVLLSCNFVVDSTNGNGFGVRALKGSGVSRVYMHTSATPAAGSPNPASGVILVQFTDTYSRYLSGFSGQVSPQTGSALTSTVSSVPNTIVSLGSTTAAQWQAAGLPVGVTPSVGATFVPLTGAAIAGGGAVELVGASGIDHIEVCGDPNQTIISPIPLQNPGPVGSITGGEIVLQCLLNSTRTAPADGSVVSLTFYLSNSSVALNGQ
jgi:hypothetical protein